METAQTFLHKDFGKIRTVVIDGVVWFVGRDVAKVLGYINTCAALIKYVNPKDQKAGVAIRDISSNGIIQSRHMSIINESGLYALVLSSKLPQAQKFKHWVTSEVLPAIRKNGAYFLPNVQPQILQPQIQPANQNSIDPNLRIATALKDIEVSMKIAKNIFNIPEKNLLASCTKAAEKYYGVDLSAFDILISVNCSEKIICTPVDD